MPMKYPNQIIIGVGDQVWWNDGECLGYIDEIITDAKDYLVYGLDFPGIFVRLANPVCPAFSKQRFFVYESDIASLGLIKTSDKEAKIIDEIILLARLCSDCCGEYSVNVRRYFETPKLMTWRITFYTKSPTPANELPYITIAIHDNLNAHMS